MSNKPLLSLALAAAFVMLLAGGCGPQPTGAASATPTGAAIPATVASEAVSFPPLGPAQLIEPAVHFREASIGPNKIWVYLPVQEAAAGTLPCILIAPAGTPLFFGMDLQKGDRAEHTPYVREGFAVVAYSLSGPVADRKSQTQMLAGAQAFKDAQGGLTDAQRALAFALARVPAIDPKRIYAVGHSSAATLSLLVAENEPRVAACVAYAPCADARYTIGDPGVRWLDAKIAGFGAFVDHISPINGASRLRCPLFLFRAQDDKHEPVPKTVAFVNEVKKTNPNVTFVQVQRGGHYNGMIQEGIPKAIQWLKALPGG